MLPLLEWHQIAWPAFPSHEVDFWNRKFGRTVAITPQSWNDLPSSASNTVTNRAKRQHKTSLECRRCMFINDDTQTPNLVRPFENEILAHYFSNDDDLKFIKVHISSTVFEKSTQCTLFKNYSKCRIGILAFSTNFCPIKINISDNTVWPQA